MPKRMLIDAVQPEELRIIITDEDNTIEEFDRQLIDNKATKGNIYLAKIARVEPSLQAAFVEYGAERNGFLPFAAIHPDYYQIPTQDKEALLAQMKSENAMLSEEELDDSEHSNFSTAYKKYKIQEVIKRDQVILVQVEKEGRGNKGASLTTYLSLAGRYAVLMPNSTKDGGVSRKISDDEDRKRLRKISRELTNDLADAKGSVIIRTAGAYKTKTEIKKDLAYLNKIWENIVEHTIQSKAPAFIHEEGDAVVKSIRDLYDADIEEIIIAGEVIYERAKSFMKSLLPRHINKLKLYNSPQSLFSKYGLEEQLAALYSPNVALPSGGYLVINQTEALVAIDVNSGKSTSERNVENTALKTNLEAAEMIARQLRLRDLAGLIVIDFIDMDELNNKKAVEAALKQAVHSDKAKVQIGRISSFGLLEMSRQRMRPSINEQTNNICPTCNGKGRIRPVDGTCANILRVLRNELSEEVASSIEVSAAQAVILYLLNHKRYDLSALEAEFNTRIIAYVDESAGGDGFFIEKKNAEIVQKNNTGALSGVEIAEDSITPDTKITEAPMAKVKSKFKRKQPKNDTPLVQEIVAETEEVQPQSVSHTNEESAQRKKNRRNRNKKRFDKAANKQPNNELLPNIVEAEEVNFDEEMAKRRKQNKGLLKEIWKKIVE